MMEINVQFDFTSDTPGFWDGFWERNGGLGAGGSDPDALSKTLQKYHQAFWSKELPNGEFLDLSTGTGANYLTWKQFRFGSDSITASFRYAKNRVLLAQVEAAVTDYRAFVEDYLRKAYTIGGTIIFPKRVGGINQSRGCNSLIKDRWDLTLECIRRYYCGEKSPLRDVLEKEKAFFDLFVDFKGFVEFFFLQDCLKENGSVEFFLGNGDFSCNPMPQSVGEYLCWIEKTLEFVEKRNQRLRAVLR